MDYSITAEEEEKLFAITTEGQDSPTIEEFDVDVLMSDVSGCPSPLKEALVSSIVAQSPQPSAETSCLVSSIVAAETIVRKSARSPVRFLKEESRKTTSKEKMASERKSSPKRNQARPPRRTSPRKRPCLPVGPEETINRDYIAPDKAAYCVFTQFRGPENAIKFISVRTKTQ